MYSCIYTLYSVDTICICICMCVYIYIICILLSFYLRLINGNRLTVFEYNWIPNPKNAPVVNQPIAIYNLLFLLVIYRQVYIYIYIYMNTNVITYLYLLHTVTMTFGPRHSFIHL